MITVEEIIYILAAVLAAWTGYLFFLKRDAKKF